MRKNESGNFEGASYVVQEALEMDVESADLSASSFEGCGGCQCNTEEEEEEEEGEEEIG